MATTADLRTLADQLIGPADGGYLRPWMCDGDPASARVLLIGANPATPFPAAIVERGRYLDALAWGGAPLRQIYMAARAGAPSPTRKNIETVVGLWREHGVAPVLETNVWTLPTGSLATLRRSDPELVSASSRVVPELVRLLRPVALVVHGVAATNELARLIGRELTAANRSDVLREHQGSPVIFAIPSLSPPASNGWLPSSRRRLEELGEALARLTGRSG